MRNPSREGPSDVALHIANSVHAKAKLWANTLTRPDSPSIAKACQSIIARSGRSDKRTSESSVASDASAGAGAPVPPSMLGSNLPMSRRTSYSKLFQPLHDDRSRSLVKRQLSAKRREASLPHAVHPMFADEVRDGVGART